MITKELLKAEIDNVPEENLEVLYKIIKALEEPAREKKNAFKSQAEWLAFIAATYGSTSDAPLEQIGTGTVHPEVEKISGLVPEEVNARDEYREHILKKHR